MTLLPAFRLTVYAPRSVDSTEATVLTPSAGAPHSDPFVVASVQGVTGAKPYLDIPTSRGGTIDALNKKTSVGALTVRLLDARTSAGGSNASRWVTAFIGDGAGGNILLGRLCKVEQSLDGGSTWAPYFKGRIAAPALSGKLWVQLSLRDIADDLAVDIFIGAPHPATAAYAALAQIAPLGLLAPVRTAPVAPSPGTGYAGLPLTTPLRGKVASVTGGTFSINLDPTVGDATRTIVTQALVATAFRALAISPNSDVTGASAQPPKVMVATAGSGSYVEYDLDLVEFGADSSGTTVTGKDNVPKYSTSIPRILARATSKPGHASPPAIGTSVDYYIVEPAAQPSDRTPLLIDDVNAITYLGDLCAGHFGRLDAAGNVIRSVPFSAGGIDGTKFPLWRNRVTAASKLNTELEAVCQAYHWAYYVDANGAVTLVDLHRSATTAPAQTLIDADLESATDALQWQQDRESAVTSFFGTYYPEQQISAGQLPKPFTTVTSLDDLPDIPTVGVKDLAGQSVLVSEIGSRSADMKPSALKVDAKGFRYRVDANLKSLESNPAAPKQSRAEMLQNYFVAYSDEIKGPFGLGPSYIDLVCRVAGNGALVLPGKYVALTFSALPDPATNLRGGPRLGLCVSRTDDGPRVKLRVLDAGSDSVALPPTLGTPTITGVTLSLPVTLNASSDPVRVSYAITDPSVVARPADDDPAWTVGPILTATGTATIARLPGGQRIWVRARSVPGSGTSFKLPSALTYPATDHVDITLLAAPTDLAVSGPLDALLATWVSGDPTLEVEIFLKPGALLLASDHTRLAPPLPAGTTMFTLPALTGGATYSLGVRHRDSVGGLSNLDAITFVATTTATALGVPGNATGFSGSQDLRGNPRSDGTYGLAVAAATFPGYTELQEAVETSPASGAYGTAATIAKVANVQGDWTIVESIAPNDGLRRLLTARHVRDGATPSGYTAGVEVRPWTSKSLPPFGQVARGLGIKLKQHRIDDLSIELDVYVADALPNPDAPIVVLAASQNVKGVVAEDGTQAPILGSRGNLLGTAAADLSQWTRSAGVTATVDNTVLGPDGKTGRVWKIVAPGGGGYIIVQGALGNFNGVQLSGRVWSKAAIQGTAYEFAATKEDTTRLANVIGALSTEWKQYDFSGTGAIATGALDMLLQVGPGTSYVWGPAIVRGVFAPVTDDLDTTDFLRFTVTRPDRQATATNVVLQSDMLATTPWQGSGTTIAADSAANYGGRNFSRISNALGGLWFQDVALDTDGPWRLSARVHTDGVTGTFAIILVDLTAGNVQRIAVTGTVGADGSVTFTASAGTIVTQDAIGEGVYRVEAQCTDVDSTHAHQLFASGGGSGGSATSFQISALMLRAGASSFSDDILTTVEAATETVDNPPGLVTFSAKRDEVASVSQAIPIAPSNSSVTPLPLLSVEGEGTAHDGTAQGIVRLLINFDEQTEEIEIFATESSTADGGTPPGDANHLVAAVTREEGTIASDDRWSTEIDIPTTKNWYRQVAAYIDPRRPSASKGVRAPQVKLFEAQAIDFGTAPTAAPTALSVLFDQVNGVPRATISFTINDAAAEHRIWRNGSVLKRLAVGESSLVDDGLTPAKTYEYDVDAIRSAQTSDFASGGGASEGGGGSSGGGGSGGGASGGTLLTPTWAAGYPAGGTVPLGDGPAYVNVRVANPNTGSDTLVYMSPTSADSGTFTQVANIAAGSADATIYAADWGLSNGDARYFYLVASKSGYSPSTESAHKSASFFADF